MRRTVLRIASVALPLVLLSACKNGGERAGHDAPPTVDPASSPVPRPEVLDQFPELEAIPVKITAKGFEPAEIPARKGEKIALAFTRVEEKTCGTEVIFDDLGGLEAKLPLNETVRVSFVVPKSGDMWFGCAMQRMVRGKIIASES